MIVTKRLLVINFIGLSFFVLGSLFGLISTMSQGDGGAADLIVIVFGFILFLYFGGLFIWNFDIYKAVVKYGNRSKSLQTKSIVILVIGVVIPILYLTLVLYLTIKNS